MVEDPAHTSRNSMHEEPGRPCGVSVNHADRLSEGAKPNGGRVRAAGVGPLRITNEAAEQRGSNPRRRRRREGGGPKENDAQSSTSPTQSGKQVSQGLSGVRREWRGQGSKSSSLLCCIM